MPENLATDNDTVTESIANAGGKSAVTNHRRLPRLGLRVALQFEHRTTAHGVQDDQAVKQAAAAEIAAGVDLLGGGCDGAAGRALASTAGCDRILAGLGSGDHGHELREGHTIAIHDTLSASAGCELAAQSAEAPAAGWVAVAFGLGR